MLCHDIAHDHRQKRHKNAVNEVDGLEIPHETHAAGDACANEEDHKAEFPERFQDLLARHKIGPANVAEVTEYQRDEQCAACCGEREEVEELYRAQQNAEHSRNSKGREAEIVKLQQLSLELGNVACFHMRNFFAFLIQFFMDDARHQLHEQHDADDAEQIRNAVADRDCVLILGCNSLFGCRERRSRGQTACEQAGVPNVSYNGSTESACPNTFIVSSRIDWTPYYEMVIKAVQDGTALDSDWTGTLKTGSVVLTDVNEKVAAKGTAEKIAEVTKQLEDGTLHVFDTSTFTVKGETLTSYMADVDTDADNAGDTEAISDGYFHESEFRAAPYFNVQIDGINLLDQNFGS